MHTWLHVARPLGILGAVWEDAGVVPFLDDDEGQPGHRVDSQLQVSRQASQPLRGHQHLMVRSKSLLVQANKQGQSRLRLGPRKSETVQGTDDDIQVSSTYQYNVLS